MKKLLKGLNENELNDLLEDLKGYDLSDMVNDERLYNYVYEGLFDEELTAILDVIKYEHHDLICSDIATMTWFELDERLEGVEASDIIAMITPNNRLNVHDPHVVIDDNNHIETLDELELSKRLHESKHDLLSVLQYENVDLQALEDIENRLYDGVVDLIDEELESKE